ncbi:MAG: stalk domain-containing protein [Solibacillus sp.]
MNMKRIAPLAMSALLLGSTAAFAEDLLISPSPISEQQEATFMQVTGTVDQIEVRGDQTYYINEDEQNPFYVTTENNANVYDAEGNPITLKEGDAFTAFIYANRPMILIYPPHYTAAAIVKKSDSIGTAEMGTFDENLVNENNTLKLNISADTVIVNEAGAALKVFTGGDALVFYTTSTRSIPAQTTPSKIVVFHGVAEQPVEQTAEQKLDAVIGPDFKLVNGTKMVPLRIIAEHFGYKVESTGKGAIVSKGAPSYTITRGEKSYGYNRALRTFTEAPALLEKNKTYVEYDFALELVE